MIEIGLVILVGAIGGIAVGLQGTIAGVMGTRVGSTATSFIIHIGGAALSGVLLLARGGEQIQNWRSLSWYMLGAGALGVLLYITLSYTFPRLGATGALMLIIVGQLLTGIVVDHFGLFGTAVRLIDGWRVIAIGLLLIGGYLVLR